MSVQAIQCNSAMALNGEEYKKKNLNKTPTKNSSPGILNSSNGDISIGTCNNQPLELYVHAV